MTYGHLQSDLEKPQQVLSMLGSLWSQTYDGRDLIRSLVEGRCETSRDTNLIWQEAVQCLSRQQIPLYEQRRWYAIRVLQSEIEGENAPPWLVDDPSLTLDRAPLFRFDEPLENRFVIAAPAGLAYCQLICDQLNAPAVTWSHDLDFKLDAAAGQIRFRENPFENPKLSPEPIFEDGEVADQQLTLWLFRPQFDRDRIYQHFGYLTGIQLPTSEAYKRLVNAVLDAWTRGSSKQQLQEMLSVVSDIPLVKTSGEVVEAIFNDAEYTWVCTDQQVYRHSQNATVNVEVGDTLQAGQSLVDELQLISLNRGLLPDSIPFLTIPNGCLPAGFLGDLVFENREVELEVDLSGSSPRVEFAVGGFPADVDRFWDLVHDNRLAYGQSLYDALRSVGPLSETINPAQFLAANVFRNQTSIAYLAVSGFGPDAIDLGTSDVLREIVPPQQLLLLVMELPVQVESATIGGEHTIGISETLEVVSESVRLELPQTVSMKAVSFTCH